MLLTEVNINLMEMLALMIMQENTCFTVSQVVNIDILSLNLDDKVWLTDLINLMDMLARELLDSQCHR